MTKISKYQIFSELQHGPITRVYKAFQPELQRPVLVKQLNPDRIADAELVERFQQEGLILARVNSPHVITIFDFGFEDGIPFLVTEFIEGTTLAGLIHQQGELPWDIGLYILQQLAQGLMAIHHHNIIHRDIKPENIFISSEGDVKLGDLGFSTTLMQVEESIQGTPAYLAPEIVTGEPVDFRSDLYSLGLVGYEMLTGENPFAGETMAVVLNRIVNLKPITIHNIKPGVPEQLSLLITRSMARQPDARFQSVKEFFKALDHWKIAAGINVDRDRLISFIENPQHYQSTPVISQQPPQMPASQGRRRKTSSVAIGAMIMVIILILLSKQLNHGFNFWPAANDTSSVAQPGAFSQPSDESGNIAVPNQGKKMSEQPMASPMSAGSVKKNMSRDSLTIPAIEESRLDTVVITTDPRALVFRQGDSLGITPLSMGIDARTPQLELEFRSPGFPAVHKTVNIMSPVAQKIHINLWKEVGYFEIDIIPWGVIWVDGDSIDVTPLNRPLILAPGNHRLMVRHPSLKSITEPFYIAVGETLRKSIQLQRAP